VIETVRGRGLTRKPERAAVPPGHAGFRRARVTLVMYPTGPARLGLPRVGPPRIHRQRGTRQGSTAPRSSGETRESDRTAAWESFASIVRQTVATRCCPCRPARDHWGLAPFSRARIQIRLSSRASELATIGGRSRSGALDAVATPTSGAAVASRFADVPAPAPATISSAGTSTDGRSPRPRPG